MSQNYGPNPANGQFYPNVVSGNAGIMFQGGNQAVQATAMTAGLTTTYTGGLILANPAASTVNLVLLRVSVGFIIAQPSAASVVGLGVAADATAITTPGTALTSQPCLVGSTATASGLLYSPTSATLPAALVLARLIGVMDTGALTTETATPVLSLDLQGGIVLPPGSYAGLTVSAANAASSSFANFVWCELAAGATAG